MHCSNSLLRVRPHHAHPALFVDPDMARNRSHHSQSTRCTRCTPCTACAASPNLVHSHPCYLPPPRAAIPRIPS